MPKQQFPYKCFYKVSGGNPILFGDILDAYSSEQALMKFKRNYPELRDYMQMAEVWVEIDNDEIQRREQAKIRQREREQDKINNAWYNKD